jgi:radical SAM superfamily enzyme YgiQ (UPF0313 family)
MNLLLINPRDPDTSAHSNHFPPLSIAYVAALTPPEWHTDFIDENFDQFSPRKADLVGISAMTIQVNRAYEIARIYRAMGIPVVIGGIHASMRPQEALAYADSVVIGEAEGLWPRVLSDFVNGILQKEYRGTAAPSLNNLALPRRDLFGKKYLFDCIQTSRGCPFNCDFCSVPAFNGHEYRLRPVEDVIKELRTTGKKFLFFVDDNIVGYGKQNEERAIALFEAIHRNRIRRRWVSQASTNIAGNGRLLSLMKRTGCMGLLIGFESLDPGSLRRWGKTQNLRRTLSPEQFYTRVIHTLHSHGIAVDGYFCFGFEDTPESILRTTDFILNSRIDIVHTPIIVPAPGTLLYERLYSDLEFRDYPADWKKYLGRLVYRPRNASKKEFYEAFILSSKRIISLKQVFRRASYSLTWSRDPVQSIMILLFNLGYRRLRQKGLSVLMDKDPDFQAAYETLKNRGLVSGEIMND